MLAVDGGTAIATGGWGAGFSAVEDNGSSLTERTIAVQLKDVLFFDLVIVGDCGGW